MDFDLRKYLAEGRLFEEDMTSKAVSVLKSYKGEVKGLEDYIKYLMNTNDDISSSIQAVADDMDRDNDAEDSLRRDLEKLSLAEGKLLKEEQMGSYGKFLKVVKSYEDEEILSDFLDSYPKGQDISKSEYERFTEKHLGLADPEDYRGENWKYIMSEGKLIKEELTWFIDDENTDVRYENDAYLKEVGDKIKELHPDISSEDLNKIIIMTGEQYSREEDFHGDSIPSNNFVEAAVEIYQTDVLGSDGEDDEDFDRWAPENLDGDFPKDSRFAGWTQAQYDTYQEDPYTYLKDKTNPRLK